MIIIHAKFQLQADQEQAFLEEIRQLITGSRAESANFSYDLMKDTENEYVYTMVEVWADLAGVESHNKSDHYISFVGKAPQYLARPLDVKVYESKEI
ncbi:putative quinol monooxygenase [Paenisporosarcina antarctica]|uniref:Antibiotic biosynthesis monooxygenase n=1 Tax=Paenisporosarcina antarctica TaxID=417367 RepID=A0A4V1AMR7_9BACL|nr:putative quinol monooxygenase [Paenisporosarcina antarctica]QBP40215.1 antibiotic biosynthesis monooxygenase [Paenisporosarcina antarctica]